jgi:hypothetical protein
MPDAREAIRAKIRECASLMPLLRSHAINIGNWREVLRGFYASESSDPEKMKESEKHFSKAVEDSAPLFQQLIALLRGILDLGKAADDAGYDVDLAGIEAFVAASDVTKVYTLDKEFELIERQISVDPLPISFSIESLVNKPKLSQAEPVSGF